MAVSEPPPRIEVASRTGPGDTVAVAGVNRRRLRAERETERIFEMCSDPQAAGIDITPVVHRRFRRQEKSVPDEMHHARQHIARRCRGDAA